MTVACHLPLPRCHLSDHLLKGIVACVAGDAIAINMPMTVHAVIIYLGVICAGCAAVSIADSFAPSEISTRLDMAQTKAIFVQDVIQRGGKAHPLYQRVVQAKGPKAIVLPAVEGKRLQVRNSITRVSEPPEVTQTRIREMLTWGRVGA